MYRVGACCGAVFLVPFVAQAQYTYYCTRVLDDDGCAASGGAMAVANGASGGSESDNASGELAASDNDSSSVQYGGAGAQASGGGSCSCPTARGDESPVPEVEAGASSSTQATGSWAWSRGGGSGVVGTGWVVNECEVPGVEDPVLYGSIYLIAAGGGTGNVGMWSTWTKATCGGSTINAIGDFSGNFNITGTLKTSGGDVSISQYSPGGVNVMFNSQEPTFVGALHGLSANSSVYTQSSSPPTSNALWSNVSTLSYFEVEGTM